MIMDVYLHTALAMSAIGAAYYAGDYFARVRELEIVIGSMLDTLEKEGFVATKEDEDGDKELILIEDIIKKELDKS
jgi:hypothetical protein|tara:strand:- start:10 stop:237 length:228 start_codon:yes stop_codon:yes gene_type:complete